MIAMRLTKACGLALAALTMLTSTTYAQTVNPSQAQFTQSPDHNVVDSTGAAIVLSYELRLFQVGSNQPFRVVSLGKPAPDSAGIITADLTTVFAGWPVPGTNYVADVAAVGPSGTSPTAQSNTFSFAAATLCSFSLSSHTLNVAASGGAGSATVTAPAGCGWNGVSNAPWIAVSGGSAGSGTGTVTFAVAANTTTSARTGTITIAGTTFTVTQSAACAFSLSTTSLTVAATGGPGSTTVTAGSGCSWTAVSSASWISVSGGSSGTGNGTVTFSVAANPTSTARTGTLQVAGRTFTVTQSPACTFTLSSSSQAVSASGGPATTGVTAPAGCSWTAASSVSWITLTSGATGTGNGTVLYAVAASADRQPRTGTITVAGRTVSVVQEGVQVRPSAPRNPRLSD